MKKKLIEVALPLEAINAASAREKSIRHGHPSTLHLWWARRPLAAARAVIFAQMVDDPSANPDLFPTERAQDKERNRLFRIIEDLVKWENTTNEGVLTRARDEIWQSWRRACAENVDHPRAKELFDRHKLPAFHDPFAGGGALPLEAQRLGLEAYASDLNPVAVLINKAMIEIPPRFAGITPVSLAGNRNVGGSHGVSGPEVRSAAADNPSVDVDSGEYRGGMGTGVAEGEVAVPLDRSGIAGRNGDVPDALRGDRLGSDIPNDEIPNTPGRGRQNADGNASHPSHPLTSDSLFPTSYPGARGLAEDVRFYGQWMRDEAEKRIGRLYPKIEVTEEMTRDRPDLKPYLGQKLTVIAWLWARTVHSPNPAFADVEVPLVSTFMLSTKKGKEAYVEPVIEGRTYRFTVRMGTPKDTEAAKNGTKLGRGANFQCIMSEVPVTGDYIKAEGKAGRMGARMMAIVAEGKRGRVYLAPTAEMEEIAGLAEPEWKPDGNVPARLTGGTCVPYGLEQWGDLFTPRQLVALTTFSDLVGEARERVRLDAIEAGMKDDGRGLEAGGNGATAYAEAVGVYLAFALSRSVDRGSTICSWDNSPKMEALRNTFGRQAIPMVWDFAEGNPFSESSGNWLNNVDWEVKAIRTLPATVGGKVIQVDAVRQEISSQKVVSTDPPYYNNIGYADLSDFFYVWLRRSLKSVFPDIFATLAVPKAEELVATPYRHGSKENAEKFFLDGMTQALHRLSEQGHPAFPVTIYYAFKQSETESTEGTASTGWETFLAAVIQAGFAVTGTWPMRTELSNRMIGSGTNALASSIVLVCRPRPADAPTVTRREFIGALRSELPAALIHLQQSNIAPVDLAQAAIGPGMAVYTRYGKILDAEGKQLPVREALALINQTLDEVLAEQEGDFDPDSRWALAWFEGHGFGEGEYGLAETLSKAKNTSVGGMVQAGILASKGGRVRLLRPSELPTDWDPSSDSRLPTWEVVHHLIRVLEADGETGAAALVAALGPNADPARELAYRLYTICERKKRAAEALSYNALVQSWPEIARLSRAGGGVQGDLWGARK